MLHNDGKITVLHNFISLLSISFSLIAFLVLYRQ